MRYHDKFSIMRIAVLLAVPCRLDAQVLSIECPRTSIFSSSPPTELERQTDLGADLDGDGQNDQLIHAHSDPLNGSITMIRASTGGNYLLSVSRGETEPRLVTGVLVPPSGPIVIEKEDVRREGMQIENIYHIYRLTNRTLTLLASIHNIFSSESSSRHQLIILPLSNDSLGIAIDYTLYFARFDQTQCNITRRRASSVHWTTTRPVWNTTNSNSTCHAITRRPSRLYSTSSTSPNDGTTLPAGTRLDIIRLNPQHSCTICQYTAEVATQGLRQRGNVELRSQDLFGDCSQIIRQEPESARTTQD